MNASNLGKAGTRIEVAGIISAYKTYPTPYGTTTDVTITMPDGGRLRWRASKDLFMAVGDAITVRATVNGYDQDDEGLIALVTRGSVIDGVLALV